jgi:restriction endonuclease S subunit
MKYLAKINQSALSESTNPDREIRYLDISGVGRGALVAEPEAMTFGTAPSRARRLVRDGDTIVSTVRTYLRAVLPIRSPDPTLVVSTGFAVLTPKANVDPEYFAWAVQSDPFIEEIVARSVGVSYPGINASDIGDIRVPIVDLTRQRAIAEYLDRETARIDALITKKQRMIELFKERRQALITSAVTGETTSRGGGVSGRLKSLASLIVDLRDNGALPCIALEHLAGGTGALEPGVWLPIRDGGESGFSAVLPGDVLFGKLRPYLAKTLLIREPAYASTELLALRPSQSVDARYFAYLIGSRPIIEWATASSDGTKMPRTSWEKLGEFRLSALPDLDIQRSIADYLDRETARIDAITVPLVQQIDLLRERRQALITAAVTGELDVAGVAA